MPNKVKANDRSDRWARLAREPGTLDAICSAQAGGRGVPQWCRERDVRYRDVMRWIDDDLTRAFEFEMATKARGAASVAQLESVTRMAIAGAVDPRAAAVASKNYQWLASVYDRKRFGEQMRVDHRHGLAEDHLAVLKGLVSASGLQHAPLLSATPARDAREERPAIEAEFRSVPDPTQRKAQHAQPLDRAELYDV